MLSPVAATTHGALEQGLSLAYPIGDLLMLAVILSVITLTRERDRALAVLLAGLVLFALADVAFAYATATDQYASGGITAWAWFCGFLLIGVAAVVARSDLHTAADAGPEVLRPRWTTELVTHLPAFVGGCPGRRRADRGRRGLQRHHRPDPRRRRPQRPPPPRRQSADGGS